MMATLQSGWLTSGPGCVELEERFAGYTAAAHAMATSSCTAALHLSMVAAGLGAGRRGDHDLVHLAGDDERDDARGRDAGVRRRRPRTR